MNQKTEWHDWFAWHPVKAHDGEHWLWRKDKWVWLVFVERRLEPVYGDILINCAWHYREKR